VHINSFGANSGRSSNKHPHFRRSVSRVVGDTLKIFLHNEWWGILHANLRRLGGDGWQFQRKN